MANLPSPAIFMPPSDCITRRPRLLILRTDRSAHSPRFSTGTGVHGPEVLITLQCGAGLLVCAP
eukprot:1327989-Prymnesium_polylepis.1